MERRQVAVADERRARGPNPIDVERAAAPRRCRSRRARRSRRRRPARRTPGAAPARGRGRDRPSCPAARRRSRRTRARGRGAAAPPLRRRTRPGRTGSPAPRARRGCPARTGRNLTRPAAVRGISATPPSLARPPDGARIRPRRVATGPRTCGAEEPLLDAILPRERVVDPLLRQPPGLGGANHRFDRRPPARPSSSCTAGPRRSRRRWPRRWRRQRPSSRSRPSCRGRR